MNPMLMRSVVARRLIGGGSCGHRSVFGNEMPLGMVRSVMTGAESEKKEPEEKKEMVKTVVGDAVASYWGIKRPKIVKEDGTEWPWKSFMPWETYRPDTSIDMEKHHVPKTFLDKVAFRTVKTLRVPTDVFF